MGAASCDLPALVVSGGPMLNGKFRGTDIGSGTDVWRFSEEVKAGAMSLQASSCEAESVHVALGGHCMSMGTASTMASMVEALGLVAARQRGDPRGRLAPLRAGAPRRPPHRRAREARRPDVARSSRAQAFENAIRVNGAVGGSTNAVLHLLAIAGRVGVPLTLDDWDDLGRDVPTLVDLMPSGRFLMEDFYYAGGLPAVLRDARRERAAAHGRDDRDRPARSGRTAARRRTGTPR